MNVFKLVRYATTARRSFHTTNDSLVLLHVVSRYFIVLPLKLTVLRLRFSGMAIGLQTYRHRTRMTRINIMTIHLTDTAS